MSTTKAYMLSLPISLSAYSFQLEKDDPAYQLLAEQNSLDIQLYEYIEELYVQQKELIESYKLGNTSDEAMDLLLFQLAAEGTH